MPSSLQLKKIQKQKLGIRFGADVEGAAYAMTDMGDEFLDSTPNEILDRVRFILNPVRGGDWERAWAQRYYNSVLMIKLLAPHGRLMVVSGATPTAERYAPGGGKGHGKTFRKCNRLPHDSQILAYKDYGDNDTVEDLLEWITSVIDGLPDPGNNFL